jgi:hypothetical protein
MPKELDLYLMGSPGGNKQRSRFGIGPARFVAAELHFFCLTTGRRVALDRK